MIGTIVAWGDKFLTISTKEEVYRTIDNPYDEVVTDDGIYLDCSVEFDVVDNRAVNLKRVYFAPDMSALLINIHKIEVFNENDTYCNELESEGSLHYQIIGRVSTRLTKNKNTLDIIMPVMRELGLNLCHREYNPLKLTVKDGEKPVEVYDHSFQVGIISTFTRVKDAETEKKAWSEYNKFSSEIHDKYFKLCFEDIEILEIQKKLYFGSSLSRKYNQFKYRNAKYDSSKI